MYEVQVYYFVKICQTEIRSIIISSDLVANMPLIPKVSERDQFKIWCNSLNLVLRCSASELSRAESAVAHSLMGYLHDPANVQQTSSKCIQNTRANAGRLLPYVIMELDVCWIV